MHGDSGSGHASSTLRPALPLFRQSLLAVALGSSLIFGELYSVTIPNGDWRVVLTAHVGLIVVTLLIAAQFLETRIVLTPDGLVERGFNGGFNRVARDRVASVLLVEMYQDQSAETLPHLFVSDADGGLLLRMRGQYWRREDMEKVARHLGVPVERVERPVSKGEFYASSPELLYWFERATHDRRRSFAERKAAIRKFAHSRRRKIARRRRSELTK